LLSPGATEKEIAMRSQPRLVLCAVLLTSLLAAAGCDQSASSDEAAAAASAWIAGHAAGLTIEGDDPQTIDADVVLDFGERGGPITDPERARESLRGYELRRVPVDVAAPGWTFEVTPSRCRLTEGLTFERAADGRVAVRIETPLVELRGVRQGPECIKGDACLVSLPYEGTLLVKSALD
jgi:hypothetical protein